MSKYIDAEKLIAEIEVLKRRKGFLPLENTEITEAYMARGVQFTCDDMINIIRSLQQNQLEVDLEKEPREKGLLKSKDPNLARFAMYWYGDDDSMFLSNVFVGKHMRRHGCGNFILEAAEEVANMYNADSIYLKTKKDSFAHRWYKRHGYVDDELDEDCKTMIWMKKML